MGWRRDWGGIDMTIEKEGVNNFDGGLYLSFEESGVEHDAVL